MQFQVPQFIEVEDKIFGPLTFRQFVFIAGGLGICYVLWRLLPIFVSGPLVIGTGALAAALAFMQYNGRPFIVAIENGFFYLLRSKLYLWNNERPKTAAQSVQKVAQTDVYVPKLSDSRLHELAWSLDIKERIADGVAGDDERGKDSVQAVRAPQEILTFLKNRS